MHFDGAVGQLEREGGGLEYERGPVLAADQVGLERVSNAARHRDRQRYVCVEAEWSDIGAGQARKVVVGQGDRVECRNSKPQ